MIVKIVITMLLSNTKEAQELPYLYIYKVLDHFCGFPLVATSTISLNHKNPSQVILNTEDANAHI